jgi:hypothetical protein
VFRAARCRENHLFCIGEARPPTFGLGSALHRSLIDEENEKERLSLICFSQRLDCERDRLHPVSIPVDGDVLAHDGLPSLYDFVERVAEIKTQTFARHGEQLQIRHTLRRFQILPGARGVVDNISLNVDYDMCRCKTVQNVLLDPFAQWLSSARKMAGRSAASGKERPDVADLDR